MTCIIIYKIKKALKDNHTPLVFHWLLIRQTIEHLNDQSNIEKYKFVEEYNYDINYYKFGTMCITSKIRQYIKINSYNTLVAMKYLKASPAVLDNINHDFNIIYFNNKRLHCWIDAYNQVYEHPIRYIMRFLSSCYLSNN